MALSIPQHMNAPRQPQGNPTNGQQQRANAPNGTQQQGQQGGQRVMRGGWNQNYVPPQNNQNASTDQWVHQIDGITAKEHGRIGILAHENAHHFIGIENGIQVGPPKLKFGANGMVVGGSVSVGIPSVDYARAERDPGYRQEALQKQNGLVKLAEAPANINIMRQYAPRQISGPDSNGYGRLSQADMSIASRAKSEIAKLGGTVGGPTQAGEAQAPQKPASNAPVANQGNAVNNATPRPTAAGGQQGTMGMEQALKVSMEIAMYISRLPRFQA